MATMLSVPLKKTNEIDLIKPLKNLIASIYSTADNPEDYREALNEFNKLRHNSSSRTLDRNEHSLELLYRYYDQICALEAKVPPNDLQIPFKWKDAFEKKGLFGGSGSLTISSLSYEKVCVLFNIAAFQSQIGVQQNFDSDEGLKMAAKMFQLASGIFLYLKNCVMSSVQQEPTMDLHIDTLSTLAALMLAQAQESFFIKTTHDNMKDVIVAKVAAQCEDLYSDVLKQMQKEHLKQLWDKDWLPLIAGKQASYHGLAEYHQACVANSQKAIGEEIARLQKAGDLMKAAEARAGIALSVKDHLSKIQRALEVAKKDNDFIYHERIPDVKSLAPISKASLAKPTTVPDRMSSSFKDLFESLVPVPVHQALAAFEVRKSEIVNVEVGKLREQTQVLNSILASLNLPAALEDMSGDSIPASLHEKAKHIREHGGVKTIEKLINDLPELLLRNREILDESERMLNDEQSSDTQLRSQFKDKWTRTPSEKLTEPMRLNSSKYRQIIDNAMQADGVVREKFNSHRGGIDLLSKPESDLLAALPSNNNVGVSSSQAVEQLRRLMKEVETLKAERDTLEGEIKSATVDMKSTFLSALASDGAINEPIISMEQLAQSYGDLQRRVRESVSRQETVVAQIQSANAEFCKEKSTSQSSAQRENVLKDLASSYDAHNELTAHLQEGTKFYNDLTQLLVNFQNKVSDFCFARRTEKEELMKDLQQNIANAADPPTPTPPTSHNVSGSRPVAPARPAPPRVTPSYAAPPQSAAPPQAAAPPQPSVPVAAAAPAAPGYPQPQPNSLPYPVNPQGMPMPQPYMPYPSYFPTYTPMPTGFNPYSPNYPPAPQPGYPGYPQQQTPVYPTYPGASTQYNPQQHWR